MADTKEMKAFLEMERAYNKVLRIILKRGEGYLPIELVQEEIVYKNAQERLYEILLANQTKPAKNDTETISRLLAQKKECQNLEQTYKENIKSAVDAERWTAMNLYVNDLNENHIRLNFINRLLGY